MNPMNGGANPDRRIQRTRQSIAEALLLLISEKGFEAVIVKDITERANINRSTFYAHYQDKYDLLNIITNEKLSVLSDLLHREPLQVGGPKPGFDAVDPFFIAYFDHISENEVFYKILFTNEQLTHLQKKLLEVLRDSLFSRTVKVGLDNKVIVPLDLLLDYTSSALMGITRTWLSQQMIYTPRYMALQLSRISMTSTYQAMGIPGFE